MKDLSAKMKAICDEFGINIHEVPPNIQPNVNALVKALIKERQKGKTSATGKKN